MREGIIAVLETTDNGPSDTLLEPGERALLRYALGFDTQGRRSTVSERNHYATWLNGSRYDAWMRLVERGLAVRGQADHREYLFHASSRAANAVRMPGESFSPEITVLLRAVDAQIARLKRNG